MLYCGNWGIASKRKKNKPMRLEEFDNLMIMFINQKNDEKYH